MISVPDILKNEKQAVLICHNVYDLLCNRRKQHQGSSPKNFNSDRAYHLDSVASSAPPINLGGLETYARSASNLKQYLPSSSRFHAIVTIYIVTSDNTPAAGSHQKIA